MRKVTRLVTAAVLFVMTLEVSARVDDYLRFKAPLFESYTSTRLRTRDGEGIRCNVANARFEKYQNNSAGFRGPEVSVAKPKGTRRVVCLGASETYGLYESEGGEWPAQLRKSVPDSLQIEVINAATVGLGLHQYERYFDKYVGKYAPDVVVILTSPQSFAVGELRQSKKKKPIVRKNASQAPAAVGPKSFAFSSRVAPKVKQIIKAFLPERARTAIQLRTAKAQMADAERLTLNGMQPLDVVPVEVVAEYGRALRKLITFLEARNVEVVLTRYPSLLDQANADQFPYIQGETQRYFVEMSFEGLMDTERKLYEESERLAEELQIDIIDLDGAVPNSTRFFADNVHYTDEGASLVAELVAKKIMSVD